MQNDHVIDYGDPSAGSPQGRINQRMNDLQEIRGGRRMKNVAKCGVGVVLVLGVIGMIVGLLSPTFHSGGTQASAAAANFQSGTTATTSVQSSTTASTTFIGGSTRASTTAVTVTSGCPAGYTRSPLGACVDLMTDFSNCGSLGYVCSSTYTNCSAGRCSGTVYVPVFTNISVTVWDDSSYYDEGVVTVSLPLNITMYGQTTNNVSLSINGVLCLDTCPTSYANEALPTATFGGPVAFGYWDDLMINYASNQSIFYTVSGFSPNRTTVFEFNTGNPNQLTDQYHFQIIFDENRPDIVKYHYFLISDGGASGTIGVQASSVGPAMNYSVDLPNSVTNNLILTFDTNTGTFIG